MDKADTELAKLEETISQLQAKESLLKQQLTNVDIEQIDKLSTQHKKLIHQLNDTKDLGYHLIGILAKFKQYSIKEIMTEYNINE